MCFGQMNEHGRSRDGSVELPVMRRSTLRLAAAVSLALAAAVASAGTAAPTPALRLGPLLRIQTPGDTIACPFESEPEITTTSAGTWVAYNDDTGCPTGVTPLRLTGVQLLRPDGRRQYVDLPAPWVSYGFFAGDPDLAPDPRGDGGVLLASLVSDDKGLEVAVVRISPSGHATLLPRPSVSSSDDKEFLATDAGRASRYRGSTYLVWDDIGGNHITFRAFDGHRWRPSVALGAITSQPDVAVAPNGDVA